MVAQSIVAEFCHSGAIDRSIETVKAALRERRDATCDALERHLPDARFVVPEGGYFLWVDLPEGSDGDARSRGAKERGVLFVKGTDFLLEGGESSFGSPTPPCHPTRSRRASRAWPMPTASWPGPLREPARARAAARRHGALPRLAAGLTAATPGSSSCCRRPWSCRSSWSSRAIGLEMLTGATTSSPTLAETAVPTVVALPRGGPDHHRDLHLRAALDRRRASAPSAGQALVSGFEAFTPLFFAVLLAAIGIALGFLLLIVPGIYLAVRCSSCRRRW